MLFHFEVAEHRIVHVTYIVEADNLLEAKMLAQDGQTEFETELAGECEITNRTIICQLDADGNQME